MKSKNLNYKINKEYLLNIYKKYCKELQLLTPKIREKYFETYRFCLAHPIKNFLLICIHPRV